MQAAYDAGADIVGGHELLDKVSDGMEGFDVCLCTPAMFNEVKKLQNVLRAKMPAKRRGLKIFYGFFFYQLLPTFIAGTVVEEFEEPIRKLKNSREYHSDKKGFVINPVAKVS